MIEMKDKSTYDLECKKLLSANQQPGIAKDKICNELVAGRFAGPFLSPPFDIFSFTIGFVCQEDLYIIYHTPREIC